MTEPVVKDESAVLWYRPSRESSEPAAGGKKSAVANAADITLKISLFGILARHIPERPLMLTMPGTTTVSDLITYLEKEYLQSVPELATDDPAGLSPFCRVFIDGYPIEDFNLLVDNGKPVIDLEMILLLAYEGG